MTSSNTITAVEACATEFPPSQGKNYRKTEFVLHSRVAELVGDQISRVFYNDDNNNHDNVNADEYYADNAHAQWSIRPNQLRDMVLTNILQGGGGGGDGTSTLTSTMQQYSQYPIYGSAIAFEPGVWESNDGLDEGVTYPASSQACLEDDAYCAPEAEAAYYTDNATTTTTSNTSNTSTIASTLQLTELNQNYEGKSIYGPYAFRGPPDESVYENCSRDRPEFCPSMDLAFAYDYSNVTARGNVDEWYTAPRCLYLRDGIRSGYWTSPYFDAGAGNINMVTYSQPLISQSGKFLGVTTIDVTVDALCYGDQCETTPVDYNYLTKIRPVGLTFAAIAMMSSLACVAWTRRNKKDRVVVASQPSFLSLLCIGCLIMASSIIPLSIDDSIASPEGCSKACMAFPWLLSIGFTTTFSALFSKTWRLNQVYRNASQNVHRVAVKRRDVIRPFLLLMTVNCALMITWTVVDPLIWFRTKPNDRKESQGYCEAEGESHIAFIVLIAIVNASALVLANIQAFRARNITTEFSESFYIMMTMVSLLQASIIGVPLLVLVNDNRVASYFTWSGLIFVVTTSILGLMFVPKVAMVRRNAKQQSSTENQIINCAGPSEGEQGQTPEVVIVSSRAPLDDGNGTVMIGKF